MNYNELSKVQIKEIKAFQKKCEKQNWKWLVSDSAIDNNLGRRTDAALKQEVVKNALLKPVMDAWTKYQELVVLGRHADAPKLEDIIYNAPVTEKPIDPYADIQTDIAPIKPVESTGEPEQRGSGLAMMARFKSFQSERKVGKRD